MTPTEQPPGRASGILAHISSLPSPYGIGDIGPAGEAFIRFLASAGQSCWQFLPTVPTNPLFDSSPYMSTSAFAGSPLLISPDLLFADGLVTEAELNDRPDFSPYRTDYQAVAGFKERLLIKAFSRFAGFDGPAFKQFMEAAPWLEDYALFMAIREQYGDAGWFDWPPELAGRNPEALELARRKYRDRCRYYCFEQYVFSRQWQSLRLAAHTAGIRLFGDIPIYVGLDSVDVWANQSIFSLDRKSLRPNQVAGVPPDYFSATGQRWGNPLYRWNSRDPQIKARLLDWWTARIAGVFRMIDMARIDHFRGFESYWSIPAKCETAVDGTWMPGPGKAFFDEIFKRLGRLEIIAEDLGVITPKVAALRDSLGFPGMKILQFAFDGNPANSYLPWNFTTPNCVVYTGTHDNDTTVGWFLSDQLDDRRRQQIKRDANRRLHDDSGIHEDLIYLAMSSTARLAVIPLQDVLGFGSDCRMNTPGVSTGNWAWRCAPEYLSRQLADHLRELSLRFGRFIER
jgi:4-alpha-glucanotransferase